MHVYQKTGLLKINLVIKNLKYNDILLLPNIMTSLTKIFELVQYNNYEELDKIIKYTKVDLRLSNRRNEYLMPVAIKYRSKECFDLLIESKYLDTTNSEKNGLRMAIEYYCNAMNESNSYYLMRLLSKQVEFKLDIFHYIFKYGFPQIFNEYLTNILNQNNFQKIFSYSLLNPIAMKKVLDNGFQSNLITEEVACSCLNSVYDNIYDVLFEFVNNNINVFNYKENVLKYFHRSFQTPSTIKYIVDNINKFNPNLDLSDLIISYYNYYNYQNQNYNYMSLYFLRIYHILINFESLKKLNSKFVNIENIIRNIFDEKKIESIIELKTINFNKILIIIKTIDLLFDEKYLNENSNIYPTEKLVINKPQQGHIYYENKYYRKIIILQFFIKYFETKNVKSTDKVLHILDIEIPNNHQIDIKSMLPKKIKPIN